MDETSNSALALATNPAVEKLLEFAKTKKIITWDDVIEYLGQDFVNQDELMEPVLKLLKDINKEPVETGIIGQDDDQDEMEDDEDDDSMILDQDDDDVVEEDETVSEIEKAEKASRNRLVNSDKDSSVDD